MRIQLSNGVVYLDKEDYKLVSQYRWHINDSGYVVWRGIKNGKKVTIRMHRLIMNPPKGLVVDHINHRRNDNRRSNLRVCTQSENLLNKVNQGKGYWYHKQNKNWVVEICGKYIGCFSTELEAKKIAALIRSGGTYQKPEITHCKYGHSLKDAYQYKGQGKRCRKCHSIKCKEYYRRKNGR